MNREEFLNSSRALGFELTEAELSSFEAFEDDLYSVNEVKNLTRVPKEECYIRHFLDSLLVGQVLRDLCPEGRVLDIGTGPGFPSWCLACAMPQMSVVAMDSNGKMLDFLRRHPLPNLEICQERAEESGLRDQFDLVTGRAVAPLSVQLEISAAPAKVGGYVVPMRTPQDTFEGPWNKLGLELLEVRELALPGSDIVRVFPIFRKKNPTPKSYPRRWADIKKRPL